MPCGGEYLLELGSRSVSVPQCAVPCYACCWRAAVSVVWRWNAPCCLRLPLARPCCWRSWFFAAPPPASAVSNDGVLHPAQ